MTVQIRRFIQPCKASVEPAVRQFHNFLSIAVFAGIGWTFIKSHNDIRTNTALDIHYFFRCKQVAAAIYMRLEKGTLFSQFSICCQRKYLVATAVCKNRPIPAIESV